MRRTLLARSRAVFISALLGLLASPALGRDLVPGSRQPESERLAERGARSTPAGRTRGSGQVPDGSAGDSLQDVAGGAEDLWIGMPSAPLEIPGPDCERFSNLDCVDIELVFLQVVDGGPGADGDGFADAGEEVRLRIGLVNHTVDRLGQPVDLSHVVIAMWPEKDHVACVTERSAKLDLLPAGELTVIEPEDGPALIVGEVERIAVDQDLQLRLSLSAHGRYEDGAGGVTPVQGAVSRPAASPGFPDETVFGLDLELDSTLAPLVGDSACVGGPHPGEACDGDLDCGGGACRAMPDYLRAGGSSSLAGQVGYFEGFEGADDMAGRSFEPNYFGVDIPGTGFHHRVPLTPIECGFAPCPQAPLADGMRCQYSDPQGRLGAQSTNCVPWSGSDWHVTGNKAFSGQRSLRNGIDGAQDLGLDESRDTYHFSQLTEAVGPELRISPAGGSVLSIQHIAILGWDVFSVPEGEVADRAWVMAVEVDPATGQPVEGWRKLSAFQNGYGAFGVGPFFVNCTFDPIDDFHDPCPGCVHVAPPCDFPTDPYCDGVSTEDDYFLDPNAPETDPLYYLGPSSSCSPEPVFGNVGHYTSTDPAQAGNGEAGALGQTGTGVWVNSLFSLDDFAGKTIRLRFNLTSIDVAKSLNWGDLFPSALDRFRGWNIDDVAVTGLVSDETVLAVDDSPPAGGACPRR